MLTQLVLCMLVSSAAVFAQGSDRYLREDFVRGPGIFNTRCENSTEFKVRIYYDFPSVPVQNGSSGYYLTPALTEPGSCVMTGSKFTVDANAVIVLSYYTSASVATDACIFFVLDGNGNILVPKMIPIVDSGEWLSEAITVPRSTHIAMKFWCSEMRGSLLLLDSVEVLKPGTYTTTTTTTTEPPTTLATTTTTKKGAASTLQPHWILLLLHAPFFILRETS